MQTTNRYLPDYCSCVEAGQPSPHSHAGECNANRTATVAQLNANTSAQLAASIEGGKLHAARHASHYQPQYGCPLCPMDSRYYRRHDGSFGLPIEAAIPA